MLKKCLVETVRLLQVGQGAIEDTDLLVVLTQLKVVDRDIGLSSETHETSVIFVGLLCGPGCFDGATHTAPGVDLVVENQGKLEVVIGGRATAGGTVVGSILRLTGAIGGGLRTYRGEEV